MNKDHLVMIAATVMLIAAAIYAFSMGTRLP